MTPIEIIIAIILASIGAILFAIDFATTKSLVVLGHGLVAASLVAFFFSLV